MVVLLCLLRWIYAPHQHRFLYYASFHGPLLHDHQTLIVAAIGDRGGHRPPPISAGGAGLFLGNSIIYFCG